MICENGIADSASLYEQNAPQPDFRSPYARDADRILHSSAFTRYLDKTQVFPFSANDFISHRVIHVYLLSRIAHYIGQRMGLNLDLIEAIAWGHDIGHCPFGHVGESFLSKITLATNKRYFAHNVQSYEWLQRLERRRDSQGVFHNGLNLTYQTLDGIINHNGENIVLQQLTPSFNYDFETLKAQIDNKYKYGNKDSRAEFMPATLEGCVVRFADVISFVSRDIEDAFILKVVSDYPDSPLGNTHGKIVTSLVDDLTSHSQYSRHATEKYLAYSSQTCEALQHLYYDFNVPKIYYSKQNTQFYPFIQKVLTSVYKHAQDEVNILFERLKTVNNETQVQMLFKSCKLRIYEDHIKYLDPLLDQSTVYKHNDLSTDKCNNLKTKIVVDYIAGMTDRYIIGLYCDYENITVDQLIENDELKTIANIMFFRKINS